MAQPEDVGLRMYATCGRGSKTASAMILAGISQGLRRLACTGWVPHLYYRKELPKESGYVGATILGTCDFGHRAQVAGQTLSLQHQEVRSKVLLLKEIGMRHDSSEGLWVGGVSARLPGFSPEERKLVCVVLDLLIHAHAGGVSTGKAVMQQNGAAA
jgi:hypothetical protein